MQITPVITWFLIVLALHVTIIRIRKVYVDNDDLRNKLLDTFESGGPITENTMWKEQKYPQIGPTKGWQYNVGASNEYMTAGTDALSDPPDLNVMKKRLEAFIKEDSSGGSELTGDGFPSKVYTHTTPFQTSDGKLASFIDD